MKRCVIGLVGTSGSGKNEVATCFAKYNAGVIDADEIAREVLDEHAGEVIAMFEAACPEVKNPDGTCNKAALRELLFSDEVYLRQHESFILPLIENKIRSQIEDMQERLIVLNAPTLHKTSLIKTVDCIVYVTANLFIRAMRIWKRDSLSLKNIMLRFKNQKNFFAEYKKSKKPIVVIKNNGTKKTLKKKVDELVASCNCIQKTLQQ